MGVFRCGTCRPLRPFMLRRNDAGKTEAAEGARALPCLPRRRGLSYLHLTTQGPTMAKLASAMTCVSTKGQVILPKAVRVKRNWSAGAELVVEDTPEGVLLKAAPVFPPTRFEDSPGGDGRGDPDRGAAPCSRLMRTSPFAISSTTTIRNFSPRDVWSGAPLSFCPARSCWNWNGSCATLRLSPAGFREGASSFCGAPDGDARKPASGGDRARLARTRHGLRRRDPFGQRLRLRSFHDLRPWTRQCGRQN